MLSMSATRILTLGLTQRHELIPLGCSHIRANTRPRPTKNFPGMSPRLTKKLGLSKRWSRRGPRRRSRPKRALSTLSRIFSTRWRTCCLGGELSGAQLRRRRVWPSDTTMRPGRERLRSTMTQTERFFRLAIWINRRFSARARSISTIPWGPQYPLGFGCKRSGPVCSWRSLSPVRRCKSKNDTHTQQRYLLASEVFLSGLVAYPPNLEPGGEPPFRAATRCIAGSVGRAGRATAVRRRRSCRFVLSGGKPPDRRSYPPRHGRGRGLGSERREPGSTNDLPRVAV